MGRTVAIGLQDFGDLIQKGYFYIDKTPFIKEWWENGDSVTLINRPRRFGKTLNMSMVEHFFSLDYAGREDLFQGLSIWEEEKYRNLQGTYPVICLSFANVKEKNYLDAKARICQLLTGLYVKYGFIRNCSWMTEADKQFFDSVCVDMPDVAATLSIYKLSEFLFRYYGKKVIILLDEYDTPMQEAYVDGYWDELTAFTRSLFNASFKTNPWLERALMTGITRVSKESVFSDLNNLEVVTTTSEKYETSFGFTENEVFEALEECGLGEKKEEVKRWYDGFIFGTQKDIYNPWSVLNFLDKGRLGTYWANTSSNNLAGKLLREGNRRIKEKFERLLKGETITTPVDEQIVYSQLEGNEPAVWSLLLASGYLKVLNFQKEEELLNLEEPQYELMLTNYEVTRMFYSMVRGWFNAARADYNDFISAMLQDNLEEMNGYMNRVALEIFSYFDTGKNPGTEEPERFYHGFVLGLLVELQDRYRITSNRESGFGRYDVIIEPVNPKSDDAMILEFKVHNRQKEKTLEETAESALNQIEDKKYAEMLKSRGISEDRIRCYGFAFEGKKVLIKAK